MKNKKKKKINKNCDEILYLVRKNMGNESVYGFNGNPSRNKEYSRIYDLLSNIKNITNNERGE